VTIIRNRTINREKLNLKHLEQELADPNSLRYHVFKGFHHMLKMRNSNSAFHPLGGQQILSIDTRVFALLRTSLDENTSTLCLHNVTNQTVSLAIELKHTPANRENNFKDILSDEIFSPSDDQLKLNISPYQVLWLLIQ